MAVATIRRGFRLPWAGIAIVLGVACANLVVAAAVQLHHVPDLLIIAVAVPALIALLQRPQRGLLLLVIGLPVSGILLLMPAAPAAAGGWKQFIVLVMLIGTFLAPAENRGVASRPRPKWVIGLAPLLVLGAVSGVLVGGPRAFFGLRAYFFYVVLAWAIWRCPPNRRERDTLVTAIMVVGVLEGFYAIVQQYLGPVRLNQLGYEYNTTIGFIGGIMRSFGTFDKPFGLGFFEMLVLLIAVPHMLSEPKRSRTRWFLLFLPFCVLGLAAAVVRGAILGLAVGMAYLGFGRYRVLLLSIPAALVIVLLLPSGLVKPAFSSSSSQERVTGWHANLHRITVHPFGVGVGATGSAAAKLEAAQGISLPSEGGGGKAVYEPDNSWFKILLELGVLGLWFFALVVVGIAVSTHQTAKRLSGRDGAFARGVTAMVLAAMAASFVASYFDLFPMDMFFWMLVAVVATMDTGSTYGDVVSEGQLTAV